MSSASELIDTLSRVADIFLKAVDVLENRMMMIEQRIYELERTSGGYGAPAPPSSGRREPPTQAYPSMAPDTRRAPAPVPPTPQPQAYSGAQQQWGGQRQDSYSQPSTPSYQSRPPPPSYPPQGQQPQGYAPQGYGSQSQGPMQQGPPGPRPPPNPLNIRQAVTGELKDVFARMRARAEGR